MIKVIVKQCGMGNHIYKDVNCELIHEVFPELKFIVRVAPTLDTSNDKVFPKEHTEMGYHIDL